LSWVSDHVRVFMTLHRMAGNASFSLYEPRVTHEMPTVPKSASASVMAAEARSVLEAVAEASAAVAVGSGLTFRGGPSEQSFTTEREPSC
jgi:hypothetical protein